MSSLVLIKPDAIEHKLLGWCMACFEHQGIGDIGLVQMDEELCRKHYVDHLAKDFYPGLQAFMCSAPVCAIAVNGPVDAVRSIAMSIRRQHKQYVSGPRNLVHSSDSILAAERELDIWFPYRPVRWNPYSKVVQDHRDGTIYVDVTNAVREAKGLPVPWTSELAEREVHNKPVF